MHLGTILLHAEVGDIVVQWSVLARPWNPNPIILVAVSHHINAITRCWKRTILEMNTMQQSHAANWIMCANNCSWFVTIDVLQQDQALEGEVLNGSTHAHVRASYVPYPNQDWPALAREATGPAAKCNQEKKHEDSQTDKMSIQGTLWHKTVKEDAPDPVNHWVPDGSLDNHTTVWSPRVWYSMTQMPGAVAMMDGSVEILTNTTLHIEQYSPVITMGHSASCKRLRVSWVCSLHLGRSRSI